MSTSKAMENYLEFFNGHRMPIIGLGTWEADDEKEIEDGLEAALKIGYRHIDTAFFYKNEQIIGKVLTKWMESGKIKREELFIVTKLPTIAMQPDRVEEYLRKSLNALNLDCVDLYLIHFPIGLKNFGDDVLMPMKDGKVDVDMTTNLEAIWKAMELQVDAGRARSIGISNFNCKQVERIMKIARIQPANNQVEMHVFCQQKLLRECCAKHNITVCAYSPFGSPGRKLLYDKLGLAFEEPGLLGNEIVGGIAKIHGKSPAQILLKFLLQLGVATIPKSTSEVRLRTNFELFDFELNNIEMEKLQALDKGIAGRVFNLAGGLSGFTEHPEYSEED